MSVISSETPAFLSSLRAAIKEHKPADGAADDIADEDSAYLREKLLVIKEACEAYDDMAAKGALAELRQRTWSRKTKELLSSIDRHLLHSDFDEAASMAASDS